MKVYSVISSAAPAIAVSAATSAPCAKSGKKTLPPCSAARRASSAAGTDPALLRGQAGAGDDGFPLKQARLRKAACFMLGTFADEEPFFVSQIDRNPALRELVKDLLVKASNSCQNGTVK